MYIGCIIIKPLKIFKNFFPYKRQVASVPTRVVARKATQQPRFAPLQQRRTALKHEVYIFYEAKVHHKQINQTKRGARSKFAKTKHSTNY